MEHDLVLEGRVVAPGGIQDTEVAVDEGLIAGLGHGLRGARRILTGRSLIFPGFVDMHVHMREPGWEHKEDFRSGSLAALNGGVTTVVDMPNNPTPTTTREAVETKRRLAAKALVDIRLYGGVSAGNLERVSGMADGVVGYKVYLSETTGALGFPDSQLKAAFEEIAETGRPVSVHCEDQSVIDARRNELEGVHRPDIYCDLRPPEAEARAVKKVLSAMAPIRGLRVNICHTSTSQALNLLAGARREKLDPHCEATLHHLYFSRRAVLENGMLKTNPPLRSEEDRLALLAGLKDQSVAFLVTDHAPHTEEEKAEKGAAGVPGLDDYSHLVSWLIRDQRFDPGLIARIASGNPSRFLRLDDRGEIAIGKRADFSVLDIHSPEKVRNERVRSRCGWSPYEGREFPGRARWTVVGGKVLLDDGELVS